jgi:hypothetical protein
MSAALIAQLLATFGPSAIGLIDDLIKKIEAGGDVSSVEWTQLSADVRRTGKDRMIAVLAQAGIDPLSEHGKALLAAAS